MTGADIPATGLAPRLGIFARTFPRGTAAGVAAAVKSSGYALGHWNFAAIGRPTLADAVEEETFREVRRAFADLEITIPSMSATYNVIHPDTALRARQTKQAARLIGLAGLLGAEAVTLCTGTRDPQHMWHAHPGNASPDAWHDLRASLDQLLEAAASAGVVLGVEPEPGNVVRDAATAARLLTELGDDSPVGIVFDPANLLSPATLSEQDGILTEAVDLLGPRIIGAQAKDVVTGGYAAAGTGGMDYGLVFRLLEKIAPVPLIVQDASEQDAGRVHNDLLSWHAQAVRGVQ